MDLDPGGGAANFCGGCYRMFFAKYNSSGVYQSAFEYSKNDISLATWGFGLDNSGNIITSGSVGPSETFANFVTP
jgi:hypothetical protein